MFLELIELQFILSQRLKNSVAVEVVEVVVLLLNYNSAMSHLLLPHILLKPRSIVKISQKVGIVIGDFQI